MWTSEAYSELYETPKMDIFTKIVNGSLLEAVDQRCSVKKVFLEIAQNNLLL